MNRSKYLYLVFSYEIPDALHQVMHFTNTTHNAFSKAKHDRILLKYAYIVINCVINNRFVRFESPTTVYVTILSGFSLFLHATPTRRFFKNKDFNLFSF